MAKVEIEKDVEDDLAPGTEYRSIFNLKLVEESIEGGRDDRLIIAELVARQSCDNVRREWS